MISKIMFGFLMLVLVLGTMTTSISAQKQQAVINLNNFSDLSTETKQKISTFFEQCPVGIILYKYMGQMYVYCLTTPVSGILYGLNGQPEVNVDVNVDSNDGSNNDNHKKHHDGKDHDKTKGGGGPDGDCLFNASLPKCDPDKDGNCPKDFNLNEDGNCFPDHSDGGCPEGTHGVDDDETGQCYDNDEHECPSGTVLNEEGNNCGYIPETTTATDDGTIITENPTSTTIQKPGQIPENIPNENTPSVTDEENDKIMKDIVDDFNDTGGDGPDSDIPSSDDSGSDESSNNDDNSESESDNGSDDDGGSSDSSNEGSEGGGGDENNN